MDAIKTTLFTVLSDMRYFLYAGFQNLPLSIAGLMIILGFFTAHYPFLFFSIGYLVLLPLALFGINMIPWPTDMLNNAPACSLITSYQYPFETKTETTNGIGYWVPMTFFFIVYMMSNAGYLLTVEIPTTNPNKDEQDTSPGLAARRTNTGMGLAILSLLAIIVLIVRVMGCEGWMTLIGALIGGVGGYLWYAMLMRWIPTDQRLNDLFGIASRLLVPYAMADVPYACMPPIR